MPKISAYGDGSYLRPGDYVVIVRSGVNYKVNSLSWINLPDGTMINGKISPSVASNNLTVALKTAAGNDPSATDPVLIKVAGTWYAITSALSVSANAATNWCAAGSAETAAKEIDWFVYLGRNATDGVVIGFSRLPFGTQYGDFNTTSTNQNYCRISTITNAASADPYYVIGRFAATLSAGAGYTWTVPTYTPANLVQRPIYETRWMDWTPTWSGFSTMTISAVTVAYAKYQLSGRRVNFDLVLSAFTLGGTGTPIFYGTSPISPVQVSSIPMVGAAMYTISGVPIYGGARMDTTPKLAFNRYDGGNFLAAPTVYNGLFFNGFCAM